MAQADKSKFLSKLARFVANPTTDWSALDHAAAAPKSNVFNAELTQAEVFAMRYQRRKDNRTIRIKEFAMLRQVRAGVSVSVAQNMASSHSVHSSQVVSMPASVQHSTGDGYKSNTLIGEFSVNKINHIEQQMAEQWWDGKGGKKGQPQPMPEPVKEKEIPKTQMLIETQIAQFDLPAGVENSDVIAFDPAMLEPLPVASTAPAQPATQTAAANVHAAADTPVQQPVQSVLVQMQQVPQQMPTPAVQPVTAQHVVESVATAPVQQPVAVAPVQSVQHPGAPSQVTSQTHVPFQPATHVPTSSVAPVQAEPVPQAVMPAVVPASHATPASVPQTAEMLASPPSHGSGEQVDFSAEQPSAQAAATFVYRSAFADELPESDRGTAVSSSDEAPSGKSQQILTEADSCSMAEVQAVQAELVSGAVPQYAIPTPPEYTPADLPECLNEPAILFTQGNYEQTEAQLLELVQAEQLRAQMGQDTHEEPHVLLALLDFYRCTEQEEKFEAASIEMVRHFDRSAPQYQGADLGEASRILSTLGAFADIDYSNQNGWRCPVELDLTDVMLLRAQLMTQPAQVLLDWRMLHLIQDDAVEPLLDQFRDLAGRKVDLLMWGSEQLLASCVQKIESQEGVLSSILSQLWMLRLELVRIIYGQEAFDHLALEYCMALEESPPAWVRARCHFIDADNALSILDGSEEDVSVAQSDDASKDEELTLKHPLQWKGTFKGNIQAVLQAVENAIQGDFCVIDCSQFNGMDYPAAVALLEWLMLQQQAQRQIQFVQVNRLLAVFWRVLGITAQASVKLRRD